MHPNEKKILREHAKNYVNYLKKLGINISLEDAVTVLIQQSLRLVDTKASKTIPQDENAIAYLGILKS